jgi:hypothetical protein
MSDTHDHSHSHDHGDHAHGHDDAGAGHEIDRMPNGRLFNLLFGLSALTLLAAIGVIQLFNIQVEALEQSRAEQGSFRLAAYNEEMNKAKTSSGQVTINELDDKATVNTRYFVPLATARKQVLDDPKKLAAFGQYPGWKTSDDQAPAAGPAPGGAAPGGAPVPRPQPAAPEQPNQ